MRDEGGARRAGGQGGREVELEALWSEWAPRAAAYLRAFPSLGPEDREELVSEALGRAWLHRGELDPSRAFAPWFFTILRRLAIDAGTRPRNRALSPELCAAEPSRYPEAEEAALRGETLDFLRRFIAALPQRDRELASLVYGQELGLAEAAAVLGMPRGTASWRLSEVRKSLRKAWERAYG